METTTSLKTFEVTIPEKYADILKKFITSLEGKVKAQKKSGLDEALEDVKAGRIYHAESTKDFIDQAIMVKDPVTGRDVLRYGGDFDDKPADYEFSANGIVFADRKEKPAMQEVRYYYGLYR